MNEFSTMKHVAACAIAICLQMAAVPAAHAAVVMQAGPDKTVEALFVSDQASGWSLTQTDMRPAETAPVQWIGDSLATYAAMLPMPSDWLLLVTGFGVIGYALRSRKQTRVNFN